MEYKPAVAALVLVSGEKSLELGLQAIVKIVGYVDVAQVKIEARKLCIEKERFNIGELVDSLIWALKDVFYSIGIEFYIWIDDAMKCLYHHELIGDKHCLYQGRLPWSCWMLTKACSRALILFSYDIVQL